MPFRDWRGGIAGRHLVLVAEDAVERAAVVEARVEGNLLDGLVGLRQQLRGRVTEWGAPSYPPQEKPPPNLPL